MISCSRKKSVDDLITSSQVVLNQAISLTTSGKDSKSKRSPSPTARKSSHKRDKSDVSTFSTEFVELVSDTDLTEMIIFQSTSQKTYQYALLIILNFNCLQSF